MKKIGIIYNEIINNTPDEIDVLAQRDLVKQACENKGLIVESIPLGENIHEEMNQLNLMGLDVVFNLVESTWGKGELIYFAPAMLNLLKIPYSGVPLDAMFVTTNKVLAKKIIRLNNLPTADFYSINQLHLLNPAKQYIVKPIWEEASVGISEKSVFAGKDLATIAQLSQLSNSHYFVEEYIEGREFNISLLASKHGVEVLPAAEMIFSSFYDDKPKVIGYKAKWDEESEEYAQTNRAFGTLEANGPLLERLEEVCRQSWEAFNLKGYVRIDFRIDAASEVYILEINGNPCIAPDSGFVAATQYAGYSMETMVERILEDLN